MTITPANALREGDILEPDGEKILKVEPSKDRAGCIEVTMRSVRRRRETWLVDSNWIFDTREPRP